jgi:cytochrome c biogenesis protein CcdA
VFDDFLVGESFGFVSCACISGGPFEFSGNSMYCYGSLQVICYLFIYVFIYLLIYLRFILELFRVADDMYHGMIKK